MAAMFVLVLAVVGLLVILIRPRWVKTGIVFVSLWLIASALGTALGLSGNPPFGFLLNILLGFGIFLLTIGFIKRTNQLCTPDADADQSASHARGSKRSPWSSDAEAEESSENATSATDPTAGGAAPRAVSPSQGDDPTSAVATLQAAVLQVLHQDFGGGNLAYDSDGVVAFRYSSTAVFINVQPNPLHVRILAPLLSQVPSTPALSEAVNDLNRQGTLPGCWVFLDGDTLAIAANVPGEPFVRAHFVQTCSLLARAADQLDDELQAKFGGQLASQPAGASVK